MSKFTFLVRYKKIIRSVEENTGMDRLSFKDREVLRLIAEWIDEGRVVTVSDAVKNSSLGTPPTLYASLHRLEEEGWVQRRSNPFDGRSWKLVMSSKAANAFTKMAAMTLKKLISRKRRG